MFVPCKEKNLVIGEWASYYDLGIWREAVRSFGEKEGYVSRPKSFDVRKYRLREHGYPGPF